MISRTNLLATFLGNEGEVFDYQRVNILSSILFWTQEQKKLIESYQKEESIILMGDYGSGKTVVIQSVVEKLLSMSSGRDIVYINALDWSDLMEEEKHYKTWEDVLDVIVKLRISSEVTVLDIGTMRNQYIERNKGQILLLFISFY